MQTLPCISSLTRFSRSDAAIPFGCLSVFVTWLNLITISPSSQAASAVPAVIVVSATAATADTRMRIFTSQVADSDVLRKPYARSVPNQHGLRYKTLST